MALIILRISLSTPNIPHLGYRKEGLKILCQCAEENGLKTLYGDIAFDNSAIKLFLDEGFVEEYFTNDILMLKKDL